MSVLRVVLDDAPLADRAEEWALFDAHGHRLQSGHGAPATWPVAARRECVLAATRVRLTSLLLPPMPPDRVASAAAFALEDAFARPASEQHMLVSTRDTQGRVVATVTQRTLVMALAHDFARLVAVPALAPLPKPGHWEQTALAPAYVRPLYLLPMYQKKVALGRSGWPWTLNPEVDYRYAKGLCPVVERMHDQEMVFTPLVREPLTEADMDDLAGAIRKVLARADELSETEHGCAVAA